MTEREQLVRAVIAEPDANAPRQAFASWGGAHDDLQGELARIQLAEAHERRVGSELEARRLNAQAFDLIAQHRNTWARDVLPIASQPQFFRILHLAFNDIGLEGVEALAGSKQLPQLRYV